MRQSKLKKKSTNSDPFTQYSICSTNGVYIVLTWHWEVLGYAMHQQRRIDLSLPEPDGGRTHHQQYQAIFHLPNNSTNSRTYVGHAGTRELTHEWTRSRTVREASPDMLFVSAGIHGRRLWVAIQTQLICLRGWKKKRWSVVTKKGVTWKLAYICN